MSRDARRSDLSENLDFILPTQHQQHIQNSKLPDLLHSNPPFLRRFYWAISGEEEKTTDCEGCSVCVCLSVT